MKKHIVSAAVLALASFVALPALAAPQDASPAAPVARLTPGQVDPMAAPKLAHMKLSDPLVQKKYAEDADLMKHLRGVYSDACARGIMVMASKQVKANMKNEFTAEQIKSAGLVLESNRLWKMTGIEMEVLFGKLYLEAANYCDCMVQQVPNTELANPRSGLDALSRLPAETEKTCQRIADEKTAKQELMMAPPKE